MLLYYLFITLPDVYYRVIQWRKSISLVVVGRVIVVIVVVITRYLGQSNIRPIFREFFYQSINQSLEHFDKKEETTRNWTAH